MHHRPRLSLIPHTATLPLAAAALTALTAIAGCGGTGTVEAAPDGDDPACLALVDRLPGQVLDAARNDSPAADGVATWGDPAVVLRCGVVPPGTTSAPCLSVDGLDWLLTDDDGPIRFVTYGTRPAVEVVVPDGYDRTAAPAALGDVGAAVAALPATKRCS